MSGIFLRQATASQSRALGPFVDDVDFKTPKTALTIANTDIKIVSNGGASANKNSGGGTHRVNGVYGVTFDATDTATVGELEVSVVVAGALPVFHTFNVLEEATYDITFASAATGAVPVASIAANAIDANAIASSAITAAKIGAGAIVESKIGTAAIDNTKFANGAITAGAIAADAITAAKLAADVTTELQTGLATAAALATVDGTVNAILTDTAEIGVAGAGLTAADDAVMAAIAALNNLAAGAAMTLTAGERNAIATALLDLTDAIETGLTVRQAYRLLAAAEAGKTSGMDTGAVQIRNAVMDTKVRITATCDASGNRTAVSTDVT